jgi:hypothetical protein
MHAPPLSFSLIRAGAVPTRLQGTAARSGRPSRPFRPPSARGSSPRRTHGALRLPGGPKLDQCFGPADSALWLV